MAKTLIEQKTVLLLSPEAMPFDCGLLVALHIEKEGKKIDYKTAELNTGELRKHFSNLPQAAKDALVWFDDNRQQELQDRIKARYKMAQSGMEYTTFFQIG